MNRLNLYATAVALAAIAMPAAGGDLRNPFVFASRGFVLHD
jgi:hypothetical protein